MLGRAPFVVDVDVDARGPDDEEHAATTLTATDSASPTRKFLWVCLIVAVCALEVRGMQEARALMRPPGYRAPGSIS